MQDERVTEEGQAAIRAAMQILLDAQRPAPPEAAAPLPPAPKPKTVWIGGAEFELHKVWLVILLVVAGMYSVMVLAYVSAHSLADTEDRALALLASPDVSAVHLVANCGFASDTQATYWGKSGADVAVLTLSHLRPVSGGTRYRWWAQRGDHRITLASGVVDGEDHLQLVATSPELATPPDAIWVTLEVADADPTLVERTVLSWSNH